MEGVWSDRRRAVVLAGSALWCVAGCIWALFVFNREEPTSQVVDRRQEIGALLDERRATVEPARATKSERLVREPIDREAAETLFASLSYGQFEYDPLLYFRFEPGIDRRRGFMEHPDGGFEIRTNSLGMRDDEVRAEKPELRILLAGDSQAQGVCANSETIASKLENRLTRAVGVGAVEVINAATGGYGPYNYLGVIERYLELDPDVFLVVIYGGNDFRDVLRLQRYFHKRPRPRSTPHDIVAMAKALGERDALMYAELWQLCYFLDNPEDVEVTVRTLGAISLEIHRVCDDNGVRPLFAYLPGPLTGQPELFADELQLVAEATGIQPAELEVTSRIADEYLALLASRELSFVDLRPAFEAADQRLFWTTDMHLNLKGNRVVAHELALELRELLGD
jgi:hypothetical protein